MIISKFHKRGEIKKMKKWLVGLLLISVLLCGCEAEPEENEVLIAEESPDRLDVYMFADILGYEEEEIPQSFYTLGEFGEKALFWGEKAHIYYEAIEQYKKQTDLNVHIEYFGSTRELLDQLKKDAGNRALPDLIVGSYSNSSYDLYSMMEEGYFQNLTPYFESDELYSSGEYIATILEAGKMRDQQLIFPLSFDMNILMTSQESLDEKGIQNAEGMEYEELLRYFTEEWKSDQISQEDVLLFQSSDVGNKTPYYLFEAASGNVIYDVEKGENVLDQAHFEKLTELYRAYLLNDYQMSEEKIHETLGEENTNKIDFQGFSKNAQLKDAVTEGRSEGFEHIRSKVGYISDGGLYAYSQHPFAAQAGYYESRFKDLDENFICFGIPMQSNPQEYAAMVTTFGAVIEGSENAEEGYKFLKLLADTPRHMYFDMSVNCEQVLVSLNQLTQTSMTFFIEQGSFPPEIVPEGENWLEEYYEIHSMSDETKNTILKLVDSIGYAYLPDVEAQNLILEEIRSYIYRDTETIEEAYTKAMEALNQLR